MSRILTSKKRFLLGVAAALVVATAAFAYWTTTGDGDGSASVGTDADNIFVTGTVDGADLLYPGHPGRTVEFVADNPSDFNQSISKIKLVSVSAEDSLGDPIPGCGGTNAATSDFQMADVVVDPATDGDIEPEAENQALTATGTLVMNNLDSNQDDCKNASLSLVFETE